MDKKRKTKRFSVFAIIEGQKREKTLLECLEEIYHDENVKLTVSPIFGGNPDQLLSTAIKRLSFGYNRVFVWFDEDTDITRESRKSLFKVWKIEEEQKNKFLSCPLALLQQSYNESQQRNPIIIISQPICVESLILKIFGKTPPHSSINTKILKKQKRELKNSVDGIIGKMNEYEYYKNNLTKELLEERRLEIKELDLLISMLLLPRY